MWVSAFLAAAVDASITGAGGWPLGTHRRSTAPSGRRKTKTRATIPVALGREDLDETWLLFALVAAKLRLKNRPTTCFFIRIRCGWGSANSVSYYSGTKTFPSENFEGGLCKILLALPQIG